MHSAYLKDTYRAAALFSICFVVFCFTALVELNRWPGQAILSALWNPSPLRLFMMFSDYALIITVMFWAGRPSLLMQRVVLCAWPLTTFASWYWFHADMATWFTDARYREAILLITGGVGVPAFIALLWRFIRPGDVQDRLDEKNYRLLFVMLLLFVCVPQSALDLTVALHPHTFDLFALKFDYAAGLNITPAVYWLIDTLPGAKELVFICYGLTPLAFLSLALLQLRQQHTHLPNAMLLWVVMSCCALIAYHFLPITGPKYLFGEQAFIGQLRMAETLPLDMAIGRGPNPRNGMPSMHFGWVLAATIIWCQSNTHRRSRFILGAMTTGVALATLYLGEHYLIDLIVAVPFVLASIALTTTNVAWHRPERWCTVLLGFGTWLTWVILLRTQIVFFIEQPVACWILLLATLAVVAVQVRSISGYQALAAHVLDNITLASLTLPQRLRQRLMRRMGLMFFVSGSAALVYQVLFAKELSLVFGSTSTATFTVLATFLGGMAIGSLIGGAIAPRVQRPIVAYAMVELGIAVFCILTPTLFALLQQVYVFLAADLSPASTSLLVLRVLLGAGVLLVPTILMGITLPLLAQALNPSGLGMGKSVAWLYACNTAGAAFGALATSYVVIPAVGAHSTTLLAALLNLLIALGAIEIAKTPGLLQSIVQSPPLPSHTSNDADVHPSPASSKHARMVLAGAWSALFIGGLLSLGLEVVYVHMLSIVAGNSVYAFGLMLATFLTGLAIGGEGGRRLLERDKCDRAASLTISQIALAASVLLSTWGWDMIPAYFASYAGYPLVTTFGAREFVRAMVCALVMIPPTICIGLSYTIAMDLATSSTKHRSITMLGISASLNTLGNILGVLLFGFVLLPWLGGLAAVMIVAIGALVIAGVVIVTVSRFKTQLRLGTALASVIALALISPSRLNYEMLSSGANVYFSMQKWGTIIDQSESIDGGLTTVARAPLGSDVITTLLTNGKFQGNDARKGEVQAQIGFAALPLLHQGRRDNAMVLGYGTGVTSRVFYDAGFAHIDIAELSKDVVTLADRYFSEINSNVSTAAGVQTHITDGRNFLLLTKREYDLISIEITSIWFAGAASLYNREFYQLARKKLRPDGVLQQWVQLHHMAPTDLLTIIGTLRSEFNYVSLYVVGGQGILIATNDERHSTSQPDAMRSLDTAARLQPVRDLAGRTFEEISKDLLLTPAQIDVFLDRIGMGRELWISTDNNLRLEYNTPKSNANVAGTSFEENIALLLRARDRSSSQTAR